MTDTIELQERLLDLELALAKDSWIELGSNTYQQEFSRRGIATIVELARLNYIKNPLIKRGVNVSTYYVFGRGVNIAAKDDLINDVIQSFIDDPSNQRELTSAQARKTRDKELTVDGNLFFVLFVHPATGKVRIGTLPVDEIEEIVKAKNNRKRALYYKRVWISQTLNESTGVIDTQQETRYYRDFLNPQVDAATTIGKDLVDQDACIFHVKVGGFADWSFGISECYAALDWAKAYKNFLTNFAAVVASLAQFAWRVKTNANAASVAATKAKVASTLTSTNGETNPARAPGSTSIEGSDKNILDPIKTANATTPATEGKPIKLMVASAFGLPDTFFGDTDTGNLATAQSLDRPTEFQFVDRQELWISILQTLLNFVIYNAVAAPQGALRSIAQITTNEYGESTVLFDESINQTIQVDFPSILERDTGSLIGSLITVANFITERAETQNPATVRIFVRQLLVALSFQDVDELIDLILPLDNPEET